MTEEATVAIAFVRTNTLQKLPLTWKYLMTCRHVRTLKIKGKESIFLLLDCSTLLLTLMDNLTPVVYKLASGAYHMTISGQQRSSFRIF